MTALATYLLQHNTVKKLGQGSHIVMVRTWKDENLDLPNRGTHFGFVYQGASYLARQDDLEPYSLRSGMYFCLPGQGTLWGEASSGIVLTHLLHTGLFSLGGPIEAKGRFAYIDGGTSSLLIPPVMAGDPCLNAMYFPPGVDQTLHTHPSDRTGLIVAGTASLKTLHESFEISAGTVFHIPANQLHKFCTDRTSLTVVVFHPDSDAGFTHRNHPMLQRTLVDRISATYLPEIQTQLSD